jgi:hypothetical protein
VGRVVSAIVDSLNTNVRVSTKPGQLHRLARFLLFIVLEVPYARNCTCWFVYTLLDS